MNPIPFIRIVFWFVQVAARFLLAKHREFVHEMFLDGLMNEKVFT